MHKAIARRGFEPGAPRLSWRGAGFVLLYGIVLGASHYWVVAPRFGYLGFDDVGPDVAMAVLLAVPYVLCARQLPGSWERPSSIIYWMLFLVVVAPIFVLPVFMAHPTPTVWLTMATVVGAFWLLGLIYRFGAPTIPRFPLTVRTFWSAYAGLWVLLTGIVIAYYGVQMRWVSLNEIYQVRDIFKEASESAPIFARYAVSWLGNVVAPIAIARGMLTARWAWVLAGVATELFLFTLTGFKQMLFASALVIIIVVLVRTTDITRVGQRFAALAGFGLLAVTVVDAIGMRVALIGSLTGGGEATSQLVRRMVLTTAVNTNYYVEFFADHPTVKLGHSVLGRFVDYPYDLNPALLIGMIYYGNPRMSANANIWADAFANFGVIGIILFTAILAASLLVVDGVSKALLPGVGLSAMALSAFSFTNTAMLTVFLTHGFGLAVAVLFFMPAESRAGPFIMRRQRRRNAVAGSNVSAQTGSTQTGSTQTGAVSGVGSSARAVQSPGGGVDR